MQRITYRTLRIDTGTAAESREHVLALIRSSTPQQVITVNPEYVVLAVHHPELAELTQRADLVVVDGIGLAWALRKYGPCERYAGADMVVDLCTEAAARHLRVGVVVPSGGLSHPDVVVRALQQQFPGLTCAAWVRTGEVTAAVRAFQPHILFVALGQPEQDTWIATHAAELAVTSVLVGVGGAIDFLTGARRRAPRFLRRLGLEWGWRMCTQPWRLPRIIRATFGFWYTILFR